MNHNNCTISEQKKYSAISTVDKKVALDRLGPRLMPKQVSHQRGGILKMTNDILVNESDKFFGLSENSISTCYGAIASIVLAAVQLSEYSNGWVSNNICRICGRNHNVLVISLENGGHIVTLPHPKDRATKVKSSGSMLLPDIFWREECDI